MAFDTVIDKAQLESAITASANAIREKTGDTALIEWLADKGFAEAIAAIESGADLGEVFGAKVATGSLVLAEDATSGVTVDFGGVFTEVPNFLFSFETIGFSGGTAERFYCQMIAHQKSADTNGASNGFGYTLVINDSKKLSSQNFGWTGKLTKDNGVVGFHTTFNGVAGVQYHWIAIGD